MIRTDETPGIGDNSNAVEGGQLRAFVARLERLNEEKKNIAEDFKEVMTEAASAGYDKAALRIILKLRSENNTQRLKREDRDAAVELYAANLGEG